MNLLEFHPTDPHSLGKLAEQIKPAEIPEELEYLYVLTTPTGRAHDFHFMTERQATEYNRLLQQNPKTKDYSFEKITNAAMEAANNGKHKSSAERSRSTINKSV